MISSYHQISSRQFQCSSISVQLLLGGTASQTLLYALRTGGRKHPNEKAYQESEMLQEVDLQMIIIE